MSVEEAARFLGISRSTAYELANAWHTTAGRTGIPSVRLGRRILIKAAALEAWAATGDPARS